MVPGKLATTRVPTHSGPGRNPIAIGLALLLTLTLHGMVLADTHQAAPPSAMQADDALKQLEQRLTVAQDAARAAEQQRDEALAQAATERGAREEAAAALVARETELAEARAAVTTGTEELARLRTALDAAQARVTETEASYAALEAELASARSAASASESELERLRTQLGGADSARDEATAMLATRDAELAEARTLLSATEADRQALTDQLAAATRKAEELAARAQATTAEIESQRAALSSVQAERDALTARLDDVRARLAPDEGGTASVEAAKAAAAKATARYVELAQRYRRNVTPEQQAELDEAAKEQAAAQTFVARITGARGLYQVRPLDTLAIIATRFYGDSALWPRLHDANRHVLANPDHVETGVTLVVP